MKKFLVLKGCLFLFVKFFVFWRHINRLVTYSSFFPSVVFTSWKLNTSMRGNTDQVYTLIKYIYTDLCSICGWTVLCMKFSLRLRSHTRLQISRHSFPSSYFKTELKLMGLPSLYFLHRGTASIYASWVCQQYTSSKYYKVSLCNAICWTFCSHFYSVNTINVNGAMYSIHQREWRHTFWYTVNRWYVTFLYFI